MKLKKILIFIGLCACVPAFADDNGPTLRLAKAPDLKDSTSPATFGYLRNDGGKTDYVTEGAFTGTWLLGSLNNAALTPSVSWNRNTLASTPSDNWSAGLAFNYLMVVPSNNAGFLFSTNASRLQDLTKSSDASVLKLSVTGNKLVNGFTYWKFEGTPNEAEILPTLTLFSKHVYSAAADTTTGVVPTGTLSGEALSLNGHINYERWTVRASTQWLHASNDVSGSLPATHRLNSASITYQFVDAPPLQLTGSSVRGAPAPKFIPGITLSRQVGGDPLNAINKAGFTQIAFTLQY